jgi:hypothetical protein
MYVFLYLYTGLYLHLQSFVTTPSLRLWLSCCTSHLSMVINTSHHRAIVLHTPSICSTHASMKHRVYTPPYVINTHSAAGVCATICCQRHTSAWLSYAYYTVEIITHIRGCRHRSLHIPYLYQHLMVAHAGFHLF